MQVVTPDNLVEFVSTGKVADFKPPDSSDAPKPGDKPEATTPTAGAATETKVDDAAKPKDEPKRDADGKFVKAGDEPAADVESDEDAKLTEKIKRIIGKKHRAQREAEEFATTEGRRAIAAEQRAEALQRQIDALQGQKSGGPKAGEGEGSDPDEPKPADFKTVGEYTRALVKYEAKKAGETGRKNAEQSRQQSQANEVIGAFVERQEAFKKATPDYESVLTEADFEVPPLAQQYLIESEMGPQLAYHLAKNPDEVTRLHKLSPSRQLAELGKLEARLESKSPPAPAAAANGAGKVSKAPAPIQPLEGKEATVTKDPSQMSLQELRAFREQERRAKAGR
jgi:hypothetical protein